MGALDDVWDTPAPSPKSGALDDVWDSTPAPSIAATLWEDVKSTPGALWDAVKSIPSGIKNLAELPINVALAGEDAAKLVSNKLLGTSFHEMSGADYDQLKRTGAGLAGIFGPGGNYFYNKANQATGVDEPTTPEQDLAALRRGLVQFGLGMGTADVVGAGTSALGSKLSKAVGPQTEAAARVEAAKAAQQYVTPEEVAAGIKEVKGDPLGRLRTSAEVTGSPELAILEQKLGSSGDTALDYAKYQNEARPAARNFILDQVSKAADALPEETGQVAQEAISAAEKASKQNMSTLYDAIPQGEKVYIAPLKTAIGKSKAQLFGPGAPKVPGNIQGLIDYITKTTEKGSAKATQYMAPAELQRVRSHALSAANMAYRAGNNEAGALATTIARNIKEALSKAPASAKEWMAANEAAKIHYDTFGEAPLAKVTDILPSTVTKRILASPEASAQFTKMVNGDPKVMGTIRDQIASDLRKMSSVQQSNFILKNSSQLKTLLGRDFDYLDSLQRDIASKTNTQALANATRGSNTALKLSDVVERALTGKTAPKASGAWGKLFGAAGLGGGGYLAFNHPAIAIPAAILGGGVKALRDRSSGLVGDALSKALMDPQNLLTAMKEANAPKVPSSVVGSDLVRALSALLASRKDDNQERDNL